MEIRRAQTDHGRIEGIEMKKPEKFYRYEEIDGWVTGTWATADCAWAAKDRKESLRQIATYTLELEKYAEYLEREVVFRNKDVDELQEVVNDQEKQLSDLCIQNKELQHKLDAQQAPKPSIDDLPVGTVIRFQHVNGDQTGTWHKLGDGWHSSYYDRAQNGQSLKWADGGRWTYRIEYDPTTEVEK